MSKFFNKDSSDSESEDEKPFVFWKDKVGSHCKAPAAAVAGTARPKVSQPEEDQKPKSKKDAAVSRIQDQEKCVRNKLKNLDFVAVSSEFKLLLQLLEKHKSHMDRPPASYIKLLYDMDTKVRVAASDKQVLKTMWKKNASALQVLKKQVKSGIDNHKVLFDEYQKVANAKSESEGSSDSGDGEEESEEESEESDDSDSDERIVGRTLAGLPGTSWESAAAQVSGIDVVTRRHEVMRAGTRNVGWRQGGARAFSLSQRKEGCGLGKILLNSTKEAHSWHPSHLRTSKPNQFMLFASACDWDDDSESLCERKNYERKQVS
jgi:hypothetical protein